MQFSLLSSSSSGNSLIVTYNDTRILFDCGISCRQITTRLKSLSIEPESLSAICLTHDHSDHINGLKVLLKRYPLPVFATEGTSTATDDRLKNATIQWSIFSPGSSFRIGTLTLEPFAVPHDAGDPVGFVVHNGSRRLGIATDLGFAPEMVKQRLGSCHALVLESNHDVEMLRDSDRSWILKERILGRHGHLSNEQCAEVLESLPAGILQTLVLAHLSKDCNTPALARNSARAALEKKDDRGKVDVHVAPPHETTPLMRV